MYRRLLFTDGLPDVSCFVFGPRQTGKTTLLNTIETTIRYNLLESSEYLRLNRNPDIINNECSRLDPNKSHRIWIDEVQKIPALLDAVHRTIEQFRNISFILSGSSARKLRRQGVNLLGGRALDYRFHPLTAIELGDEFELDQALRFGTMPKVYQLYREGQQAVAIEILNAYVSIYLEEEIKKEALVRELDLFQRFLEVAAQCSATLINFSKIADESQISHTATRNYFSILEDTLIGFFLPAYHLSVRKQLIKQSKFYLFDNGVNRAILNTLNSPLSGLEKGAMYEQFVIQEVRRINDYYRKRFKLYFWRTESGAEVDLLVCRGSKILLAIECKASAVVSKRDLSGLKAFKKEYPNVPAYVCAPVARIREIDKGYSALNLAELIQMITELG